MSLGQDPLLLGLTKNGGAVAEWSKALQLKEKINENQKIPGSPPGLGQLKKTQNIN